MDWIWYVIIGLLLVFLIYVYNKFVRLKNQVENAWAQIDVQLKRRNDLIPNLIETVKGYAKHEKKVFNDVTKARSQVVNSNSPKEKAEASNALQDTMKSLFAVAESYPDLKANENFLQLQEEISGTENKISYARQHYNDMVMRFNTSLQTFPANVLNKGFNFSEREMFDVPESEKKNVKVSFD